MKADKGDLFSALDLEMQEKREEAEKGKDDEFAPLASRLRPSSLEEYIGQTHLLAPGRPLEAMLKRGQCYSMILWGPPGVGKTTLALLFARAADAYFEQIPAVTSGVKDIREAVDRALLRKSQGRRTIVFVDEVHRFNKSQQDAFLPHIENGTITFIGATTENPSFSLNSALLSRARVYVLKKLDKEESLKLIDHALNSSKGLKDLKLSLADGVADALSELASGDARHLLNTLEMASDLAAPLKDGGCIVTKAILGAVAGRASINYDKGGDVY
ncbi:MAG: AAA family ATPase, partial [Succinivibrio sp.]